MLKQVRAIVHGEVQGVGYRYSVHHLSKDFKVAGFVRNLDDGTVEIQAEGEQSELQKFIEAVRIRDGYISVTGVDLKWREPEGKYSGFSIQRTGGW